MIRVRAGSCGLLTLALFTPCGAQEGPCDVRWPGRAFSLGTTCVDFSRHDFDGDGVRDVVALAASTGDLVWMRASEEGFATPVASKTGASAPGQLALADVDGDGHDDALFSRVLEPLLHVAFGDGAGGVSAACAVPALATPRRPVVADLDGDGDLDVVMRTHVSGDVAFLWNDGSGVLVAEEAQATGGQGLEPVVGDLDCDGDADVVVPLWSQPYALVHSADGAGGFDGPLKLWAAPAVRDVELLDVDDDGRLDLLTCGSKHGLALTRNLGGFSFAAAEPIPTVAHPYLLDLADVDGDGDLDALAPNGAEPGIAVHRQQSGGFLPATVVETFSGSVCRLDAADLLGGPGADLWVLATNSSLLRVLEADEKGGFHAQHQVDLHEGEELQGVVTADLDGDGAPDLVGSTYFGVNVARNLGGGQFAPVDEYPSWLEYGAGVDVGDVDGDGALDVVAMAAFDAALFRGHGNGALAAPVTLPHVQDPNGFELADVDADGELDLVVATYDGVVLVPGNCVAGFAAPAAIPGTGPAFGVVATDLDGEGVLDLAFTRAAPLGVGIVLDAAAATPPKTQHVPWTHPLEAIAAGDVNADGIPDLVAAMPQENAIVVVGGSGGGTFGAAVKRSVGPSSWAQAVAVRDVNGDAVQDVVVGRGPAGLAVLEGDGLGGLGDPVLTWTLGASFFDLADLDGDGRLDAVAGGSDHRVTVVSGRPVEWWTPGGTGCPGLGGFVPTLSIPACHDPSVQLGVELSAGPGGAPALLLIGPPSSPSPVGQSLCRLHVTPTQAWPIVLGGNGAGHGSATLLFAVPPSAKGLAFGLQAAVEDATSLPGFTLSNALTFELP